LEVIVSLGIFGIILVVTMGAFLITIRSQRIAAAEAEAAGNARFALEFISRQMRVAQRDDAATCVSTAGTFFDTPSENDISFINAQGDCVRFYLSGGAIVSDAPGADTPLTSVTDTTVESLRFIVSDTPTTQPRVTIVISVRGAGSPEAELAFLNVQTTVSPRELDTL
jgi:type II secretory pathway pseudopilin PulG